MKPKPEKISAGKLSSWPPNNQAHTLSEFLVSIGIPVRESDLGQSSFLPGVALSGDAILVDYARLQWPGDLLHEAGHIAVTPPARRPALGGIVGTDDAPPFTSEAEVTAWAYAAIVALGLAPAVLFHAGGYGGRSESLICTYSLGVYPGAAGLEAAGMTACGTRALALGIAPYPHMLCWLRPQ